MSKANGQSYGKLIVFTAPSGAGKTTIVKHLLANNPDLTFSVSACTRPQRQGEVDGREYYFMNNSEFLEKVAAGKFLEWEEVYEDTYYGTLKSEIERIRQTGKHVVFDIDVEGALNIKKTYGNEALCVFVQPPSEEVLIQRLRGRNTEQARSLDMRIQKASAELAYASKFDKVLVNDELSLALSTAQTLVNDFLNTN